MEEIYNNMRDNLHVDINTLHFNIISSHVNRNNSHVDIICSKTLSCITFMFTFPTCVCGLSGWYRCICIKMNKKKKEEK